MTRNELKAIEKIKAQYASKGKEETKLDKLKQLDRQVKKPAQVFSYALGTVGALVLGTGMTMAMALIPGGMVAGVAIGCVGIIISGFNYPLHKKILGSRKQRYSKEIIELSNDILNENN